MTKSKFTGIACGAVAAMFGTAHAGDYTTASNYNTPFGMSSGQENQTVDPSLRDANGNLTLVNGQFTSSATAQSFAQSSASSFAGGVGNSGSGASFAGATAIANQLNVITTGNNNTVVVDSVQTNTGNVTATVNTNGKN
jgi:holdfast attachment protein HfaA